MTWRVEELDGAPLILADTVGEGYRGGFSYAAADDLRMAGLLEWVPDTGTDALHVLTPDGLARAQALFGPIPGKVLVKHDEGIEVVAPAAAGLHAVPGRPLAIPTSSREVGGSAP